MIVQPKDIRFCLDKADEIASQYILYVLNSGGFHRSVDDMVWLCNEYLKVEVKKKQLNLPSADSSIRGLYVATDVGYEIYLLEGMNFCWNRFVLCKELFHVLLDSEEYRTMYIYGHLKDVANSFPQLMAEPGRATVSELMAEIAAMEFLFPYKERAFQRTDNNPLDYLAIADYYKVPQFYVERYLSKSWMDYLGAFVTRAHQ